MLVNVPPPLSFLVTPFHPKHHEGAANSTHLYKMLQECVSAQAFRADSPVFESAPVHSSPDRSDVEWSMPLDSRASRVPSVRSTSSHRVAGKNALTGRAQYMESLIETDLISIHTVDHDVVDIEEQIEPVQYLDQTGKVREHTFDVRITRASGKVSVYACKAAAFRISSGIDEIVARIREQVPGFADELLVVTRADVSKVAAANARQILQARRLRDELDEVTLRKVMSSVHGWVTIEALTDDPEEAGRLYVAAVNLIDRGQMQWTKADRICPSMSIRFTPSFL